MTQYVIASCSAIAVIIGFLYEQAGGLIVSINENGSKNYAIDYLLSSGSDDNLLITIGFASFCISLLVAILKRHHHSLKKIIQPVYIVNYLFLLTILLLVNLDISIIKSIYFGDIKLLVGLIITTIPFAFFKWKKST